MSWAERILLYTVAVCSAYGYWTAMTELGELRATVVLMIVESARPEPPPEKARPDWRKGI
jgi:hypothetical protein